MSSFRLGDVIDDYCVKCRRLTNHAIVSLVDGQASKVRCRTCYHDHDYRHEQPPPSKKDLKKAELFNQVLAASGVPDGGAPGPVAVPADGEEAAPVAVPVDAAAPAPVVVPVDGAMVDAAAPAGNGAEGASDAAAEVASEAAPKKRARKSAK